ncbi:MAG TPA: ATP-dependent 6-phosphofructokinase, partial [Chitinivibrionales bacterium]
MNPRFDFSVPVVGAPKVPSPLSSSNRGGEYITNFVSDEQRILYSINVKSDETVIPFSRDQLLEVAGPRQNIYFDPAHVHAGIVTCGGLCPGLNDVIHSIVMTLWYRYGVRRISGIRFGYRGFLPESKLPVIELYPAKVAEIHRMGGTMLGSSRGQGERVAEIVDAIERMNLNILFSIGGDGTLKGALAIAEEVEKRGLKIPVVGIPKTIDNDLSFTERSFGFETAVSYAVDAVDSAHTESHDAMNGIGIVKVMGRESGFIAAHTALASGDVNYVLIPEVPFELHGEAGLLAHLEKRLENRHHAVILVAEGAGQDLLEKCRETDASGNQKLGDIGVYMKQQVERYFKEKSIEVTIKYIDPSYMIRSAAANSGDSIYCARLGTNAVHAAMAGKTKILISLVNNTF